MREHHRGGSPAVTPVGKRKTDTNKLTCSFTVVLEGGHGRRSCIVPNIFLPTSI
jgi:hypothetical protein